MLLVDLAVAHAMVSTELRSWIFMMSKNKRSLVLNHGCHPCLPLIHSWVTCHMHTWAVGLVCGTYGHYVKEQVAFRWMPRQRYGCRKVKCKKYFSFFCKWLIINGKIFSYDQRTWGFLARDPAYARHGFPRAYTRRHTRVKVSRACVRTQARLNVHYVFYVILPVYYKLLNVSCLQTFFTLRNFKVQSAGVCIAVGSFLQFPFWEKFPFWENAYVLGYTNCCMHNNCMHNNCDESLLFRIIYTRRTTRAFVIPVRVRV